MKMGSACDPLDFEFEACWAVEEGSPFCPASGVPASVILRVRGARCVLGNVQQFVRNVEDIGELELLQPDLLLD